MIPVLALCLGLGLSAPADSLPPTAAVSDFDARGLSVDEAAILQDRFRSELSGLGAYRLLERQRMADILREQGFQQSGCVSTECVVETGRILGVRRMVTGSVAHLGSTWALSAREVEVETGVIRRSATVDLQGPIDQVLTQGMKDLAGRLAGRSTGDPASSPGLFESLGLPSPPAPPVAALLDSTEPPPPPGTVPFQFVLAWFPFPPAPSVNGIALDVGWGRVREMRGVQAGIVNHADSSLRGIQGGVMNIAGVQRGIQGGVVNAATSTQGVQGGVVNLTGPHRGLQVGLVNVCGESDGAQFGLVNVWRRGGVRRISPLAGGWF